MFINLSMLSVCVCVHRFVHVITVFVCVCVCPYHHCVCACFHRFVHDVSVCVSIGLPMSSLCKFVSVSVGMDAGVCGRWCRKMVCVENGTEI